MRHLLLVPLALALLGVSECDSGGIYPTWYSATTPDGKVLHYADAPVPQECIDEWPAVVDRAVAHLTRYQDVPEARVRYWAASVGAYIHPKPFQLKVGGPKYRGLATPGALSVQVAWTISSTPTHAAAYGHELGHILYWFDVSEWAGTHFEHDWTPPLK